MDTFEVKVKIETPEKLEDELADFNVSSDDFELEFSEVGEPVTCKIVKVEGYVQPDVMPETECIADAMQRQAGPSNVGLLTMAVHGSSSLPPNKRIKTDTKTSTMRPLRRLRLENNESMEIMSSDDDAFSIDSDMEYGDDSESDSECEQLSDDDPPYVGDTRDWEPDGATGASETDAQWWIENKPAWTTEDSSMKKIKFIKKRELLIPPPKTPYDTFRWLLDDQILDTILHETNKYGNHAKNNETLAPTSGLKTWKDLTREELITFLALLMHTGTIRMNRLADYWKRDYLFNLNCFSKFMKRNRFMLIMNCLNFASPNPNNRANDNVAKLRPIIKHFNEKMNVIHYPGKELIIAKSMMFWHGRLVRQEYTDHRRLRTGTNLFMLAEAHGTVAKFQVYAGNTSHNIFRVTTGDIVEELVGDKLGCGHSVYMDRYYSSYKLAQTLLQQQTYCTGTLNKKTRHNPFREVAQPAKWFSNTSYFSNGVHVGQWRGEKSTHYITTEFKHQLHQIIKKNGSMSHTPKVLAKYRKFMSGNELQDQLMSYMPCSRKKMRWHKKIFIFVLQIYMNNAFHLYNSYSGIKKKMGYYQYRLDVLKAMLPVPELAPEEYQPPVALAVAHALSRITKTRPRTMKEKDGSVRIVKEVVRKECRQCRRGKRRTATLWQCAACPGVPAFCTACFCDTHLSASVPQKVKKEPL